MSWTKVREAGRVLLALLATACGEQTSLLQRSVTDRTDAAIDARTHTPAGDAGAGGRPVLDGSLHPAVDGGPNTEIARAPCPPSVALPRPPESGSCEWEIPLAPGSFDPQKVNFQFDSGDAGFRNAIFNVSAAASCESFGRAWYYDDPANPSRVVLCPGACAELQSTPYLRVVMLIGCNA